MQTESLVVSSPEALPSALSDLIPLPQPGRILLTSPLHFDVQYVINPHMAGHIGNVDRERARHQWTQLHDAYVQLGLEVAVVPGVEDLPDMVFCANQTLPFVTRRGEQGIIVSRMYAPQRQPEVEHYVRYFTALGYRIQPLPPTLDKHFEGMGDALWHPGRALVWGGYGFRTDRGVYDYLADWFGVPIIPLYLHDPDFYHLDTCLAPLDEHTVLIYPGAFDEAGLALIHRVFPTVLEAPEDEARSLFACNAHCPDGTHVLIQQGCTHTNALLTQAGFVPVPLETSEFLKAGGSVFCMKLAHW
ncbi:MAG: arginine deiminase-related protein [Bacteroidota bacterium]